MLNSSSNHQPLVHQLGHHFSLILVNTVVTSNWESRLWFCEAMCYEPQSAAITLTIFMVYEYNGLLLVQHSSPLSTLVNSQGLGS